MLRPQYRTIDVIFSATTVDDTSIRSSVTSSDAPQLFPQFSYESLEKLQTDQQQLKVYAMQQLLRRAAAFFDYFDDVTLPVPVLGELVDLIAASPILVAGAVGMLEQLGRRNMRGAMAELFGSLAEAGVTAIPGIEVVDLATMPMLGKRTATMAREFMERRILGDERKVGFSYTTKDSQTFLIKKEKDGYMVSYFGSAHNRSQTPILYAYYYSDGSQHVWNAQTSQWVPVSLCLNGIT